MLRARPSRIRMRLQTIRPTSNDVVIVNTCIPMYKNTTVSVEAGKDKKMNITIQSTTWTKTKLV